MTTQRQLDNVHLLGSETPDTRSGEPAVDTEAAAVWRKLSPAQRAGLLQIEDGAGTYGITNATLKILASDQCRRAPLVIQGRCEPVDPASNGGVPNRWVPAHVTDLGRRVATHGRGRKDG